MSSFVRSQGHTEQQGSQMSAEDQLDITNADTSNIDACLRKEFGEFHGGLPKSKLRTAFSKTYARLFPAITKFGVNENQLNVLLDLIYSQKFTDNQVAKLTKLLLPRDPVPEKHAIRILANLSCRDYSAVVTGNMLKWLIVVYDLLDSTENISKLYTVLFHYLTVETIRPYLCHLLYFMTRRVHVKPYRIKQLKEIVDQIGAEPNLLGLLSIYKTYQPDLEMPQVTNHRTRIAFMHPEPAMMNSIESIKAHWNTLQETSGLRLYRPSLESNIPKRRRRELKVNLPNATTTHADLKSTLIQEIHSSTELAESIDKLGLPDQLASILDNRMLQYYLLCSPTETTIARLSYWLSNRLLDLVKWNNHTTASKQVFKELLGNMLSMARITKAHLPMVETFLKNFISIWNGVEFEKEVFELLTFIKPGSFEDIYTFYLRPLYRIYCVSDVAWKARLILCYTEWLKNWALLDWNTHSKRRHDMDNTDVDDVIWLFQGLSFNIDYFQTMQYFIQHVDRAGVVGLVIEEDHPLLQHALLSFFELVSTISTHHDIPEIIIPAAPFVYRNFFSTSAMAVSRICGVIHRYKVAFEENDSKTGDWVTRHTAEYLDHFNSYVMDMCNSLWRNLALSREGPNAVAFSLTEETIETLQDLCDGRGQFLPLALSLTHSAAMSGICKRFMKSEEEKQGVQVVHNAPVSVQLLRALAEEGGVSISYGDFRVEFLEYLKNAGFHGIYDLLYCSMTSLINRKQSLV